MKCGKCGTEIADGKLYCPSCGREIQIVPEFEPEVEQTINQAMNHILDDVFHHEKKQPKSITSSKGKPLPKQEKSLVAKASLSKKHYYRWIVLLLVISIVILSLAYGYMTYTVDYQILRGNYYLEQLDYEKAMKHYEQASELEPDNVEIALYLAECFDSLNRKAGYEACLTRVIKNKNASDIQLRAAYNRLALLYLENSEYQKINSLLKSCNDENILSAYGMYRALQPEFSHEAGQYTVIIPLKINGGEKGKVYYTTDGTDPTVKSTEFSAPIFLNKGDYTIKAIYVNEFGVVSDIVTAKYSIKF